MFGWFKKADIPKADKAESAQLDATDNQIIEPPVLREIEKISQDEARFLIEARFKGTAHASLFYAQCAGMTDSTLNDGNLSAFVEKVLTVTPSEFDQGDITRAVDHHLGESFGGLLSELWENIYGVISAEESAQRMLREAGFPEEELKDPSQIKAGKNGALYEDFKTLREKCLRIGLREPYRDFFENFDIDHLVLEICLQRREEDFAKMKGAIDEKFEVLKPIFSRLRNTSTNKYGDYDPSPAFDEIEEFLNYTFGEDGFDFFYTIKPFPILLNYIEGRLDESFSEGVPTDGIDFEHWCAEKLRLQGWSATVSQASGDQGVDVLAERDGQIVAVQCKRYSKPVGNKAVQEAFTGMKVSGAGFACVISTGGFTSSARQAAAATDVWLLDVSELSGFSAKYGFEA